MIARKFALNYHAQELSFKICTDQNNSHHENAGKFCRNIISSELEKPGILTQFVLKTLLAY